MIAGAAARPAAPLGWGRVLLWAVALVVAGLTLTPLVWLAVRAVGEEGADAPAILSAASAALIGRSLLLAVLVSGFSVGLSIALAWTSTVSDLPSRAKDAVHLASVAPLAVPCYVGASTYLAAFSSRGPIGRLLAAAGLPTVELHGLLGAVLVLTVFTFPLAYLPLRAAFARADVSTWEAARVLGQSPAGAFRLAVWPQIRAAALAGGGLVALYALAEFGAVALLRYDSFPRVIYLQFHSAFDRTAAARSSLLLVITVVVVLLLSERFRRGGGASAERERPLRVPLGRLRPLALTLAGLTALLGLGVPLLSLGWWLASHRFERVGWVGEALLTTTVAGAAAATLAVGAGLALAWLAVRAKGVRTTVLVRAVELGFALPGLVIALGLTFFTLMAAPALYQGWTMLLVAYVVLFVALATSTLRGLLERLPPSLEEASRTLGRTQARTTWEVTLPLLSPGVAAAWLLVWLSAMKELPATMLLIPAGRSTLATRLWSFTDEAMYAEAALPALLLIGVAGAGVLAVRRRLERL